MTQTRSAALFERMAGLLPAGNTRATTWYAPYPVALAGGHGARVVDVDGNEYLDFLANYTAMVHGHAFPADRRGDRAHRPRRLVVPGAERGPGRAGRADPLPLPGHRACPVPRTPAPRR